jgi:serine/threonine protein kinase/Tol biopolymer transport system component
MSEALAANSNISHYRIVSKLGAGGMGEVYRALDTRLDREVAIKVLPAEFARDADRLRRFEQEARATSALNHPNILTVYDIGHHKGAPFIVAELLEGAERRAQLQEGALPVRKALEYAQQVTQGLAAAHEKGIVPRDLKPENLFLTTDGRVKILDFGLAKLKPPKLAGGVDSEAPTRMPQTDPGTVMGTVGYMSPEQVRGQEADHRSDIFSFGLILYEMLTGERAFQGDSVVEMMNAILKEDLPELTEVSRKIPAQLERVVRHCLEKRSEERFQSARDLAFALNALSTPSDAQLETAATLPVTVTERVSRWRLLWDARLAWIAAAVMLLMTLAVAWIYFSRQAEADARVIKFHINPPDKASLSQLAVSPDGRYLAFVAATGGKDQLWVRALDALTAQPLAGTEGATLPFWSPESRFIGFFASGKLKKIAVSGGPVQTVCDAGIATGGTWSRNGVIGFSATGFGLYRVPAAGGDATLFMPPDRTRLEWTLNSPSFLPDGQHFLYNIQSGRKETRGIYLGSLDGKLKQRLLGDNSNAVYAASGASGGYLLFLRDEALLAQPFDARQLKLTGEPMPVVERVGRYPNFPRGNFSVSEGGVLLYDGSGNRQRKQLIWVDREGKPIGLPSTVGGWATPGLSPALKISRKSLIPLEGLFSSWMENLRFMMANGKQLVVDRIDDETSTRDLWLHDVIGGNASRFTFDPTDDLQPVWSPDGRRIVWGSNREGTYELYQKAASGVGQDEPLLKSGLLKVASNWSLDGRFIIYYQLDPKTKRDIWVLPLDGKEQPFPFLQAEANETGGQLSPDGRWMAYASDELGDYEVYVQSFPQGGGKRQVSTKGGVGPHWRQDGKELFYYALDGKLMAAAVKTGASFEASVPRALFEFRSGNGLTVVAPYAVTADGQRFLLNTLVDESGGAPIAVVVNWAAEVKK